MYVAIHDDDVFGFGPTTDEAWADFARRCPYYDCDISDPPKVLPCSPELFQRLQTEVGKGFFRARCLIDQNGVVVPNKPWSLCQVKRND